MPRTQKGKEKGKVKGAKKDAAKGPGGPKGGVKKRRVAKKDNPLFEKRPRNFGIDCDIQPKRDLTHFVKWPKYIRLQRQRRILYSRLKVPPVINQFTDTLDKNAATLLFKLLHNHRPEDKATKKKRLLAAAKAEATGAQKAPEPPKKPICVKYGINHITSLVEQKKAKLVVIAHDVDPIELVLWLPTLCVKKGVPYCIVKGKARLGQVVHKKTATALAFTDVDPKYMTDFNNLVKHCTEHYNARYAENMRKYGGRSFGHKHISMAAKEERRRKKEEANR
jgi:large subunit ribosomal protein L7Ae